MRGACAGTGSAVAMRLFAKLVWTFVFMPEIFNDIGHQFVVLLTDTFVGFILDCILCNNDILLEATGRRSSLFLHFYR